jgi:hypothetical protein
MPLNVNDQTPEGNRQNVESLQSAKQEKIPFIDRTPVSSDRGSWYVKYAAGGTTLTLYIRHPLSGAWLSATLS